MLVVIGLLYIVLLCAMWMAKRQRMHADDDVPLTKSEPKPI